MELLHKDLIKIINESFMIGIFKDFEEEIPLYKKYIQYLYNKKI